MRGTFEAGLSEALVGALFAASDAASAAAGAGAVLVASDMKDCYRILCSMRVHCCVPWQCEKIK